MIISLLQPKIKYVKYKLSEVGQCNFLVVDENGHFQHVWNLGEDDKTYEQRKDMDVYAVDEKDTDVDKYKGKWDLTPWMPRSKDLIKDPEWND